METTPQMEDKLRELKEHMGPQLEQARAKLSDWNTRITAFIRQNPGTCLLGALAVGYVVGRLVSRK